MSPQENRWEVWSGVTKCVWVWDQLSLLSSGESFLPGDKILGTGFLTIECFFGGSVLRQIREVQRKFLPALLVFQVPPAPSNQYAKGADQRRKSEAPLCPQAPAQPSGLQAETPSEKPIHSRNK